MPDTTQVLLVPGFGDTTAYWASTLGLPTHSLSWPGIWGEPPARHPYSLVVAQLDALMADRVVIAHALGARAALEAAVYTRPRLLILIAPALGALTIFRDGKLDLWATSGSRRTVRPSTDGTTTVDYDIPYDLAADLVAHGPTPPVAAEVRIICLSGNDGPRNDGPRAYASHLNQATTELVEIDGPNRFWEDPHTTDQVVAQINKWYTAETS